MLVFVTQHKLKCNSTGLVHVYHAFWVNVLRFLWYCFCPEEYFHILFIWSITDMSTSYFLQFSLFAILLQSPKLNIIGISQFSVKALFSICKLPHLTHLIIIEARKKSVWKRAAAATAQQHNSSSSRLCIAELAKLCHPLCGKCFLDLFSGSASHLSSHFNVMKVIFLISLRRIIS